MGLAYLAKAFFLTWSIPCLLLLFWQRSRYGLSVSGFMAISAALGLCVIIYALPLSLSLHRPSIGEAGKYQVLFCQADGYGPMVPMVHGSQQALHPSRVFFDNPLVYEFAQPFEVAYSPWFNPAYWNEGIKQNIDWPLYWQLFLAKAYRIWRFFGGYAVVLLAGLMLASGRLLPFDRLRFATISVVFVPAFFVLLYYGFCRLPTDAILSGWPTPFLPAFCCSTSPATGLDLG